VGSVRSASLATRAILGALLALVLALRLLSPAGFMPAFDHGSVTIVACPDYAPAPPMAHHHHGDSKNDHPPCPYAAGAAAGTLADFFLVAAVALFGAALILGRTFRFLERHRDRERPPLRGPPLPA